MTADQWTHHDPAVRDLIRRAQADAWDEGYDCGADDKWSLSHRSLNNPYRSEVTR